MPSPQIQSALGDSEEAARRRIQAAAAIYGRSEQLQWLAAFRTLGEGANHGRRGPHRGQRRRERAAAPQGLHRR